jgi:hypothetical protein
VGNHVNQAVATADDGSPLSNIATAEVAMDADPLLEDSLVFGTVFDDRDGDGWQDSAELTGVRVQGGFAPSAYVAGSTTLDRGDGPQPLADASTAAARRADRRGAWPRVDVRHRRGTSGGAAPALARTGLHR